MIYKSIIVIIVTSIVLFFLNYYVLNRNKETFVNDAHDWRKINGALKQVSVSGSRACGVNDKDQIYCSKVGSDKWDLKDGSLKHISISGDKVCGVNSDNDIFCADNIDNIQWNKVNGKLTQIDLSGSKMCGVGLHNEIYCADYKQDNWDNIPGQLKHISIDGVKTCGTNMNDQIFCADSIIEPEWKQINGSLKQIDLSRGKMCGVNSGKDVFCADYAKDNWKQKPGKMNYVSIDSGKAYAIDGSQGINYAYNIDNLEIKASNDLNIDLEPIKTGNVLTQPGNTSVKEYEDHTCKYLEDNLKGEEQNYDIVKNYVLVNDPNTERQCYIKELSSIADGDCNMDNTDIYDPDLDAGIIDNISQNLVQDKYVSQTLPQNACMIKFSDGHVDPTRIKSYLNRLDTNLPKLKSISLQMKEAADLSDVLRDEIKQKEKEIMGLQKTYAEKESIRLAQQSRFDTGEFDPAIRHAKIAEQGNTIKTIEDQYQERSKLSIQACRDGSYVNCTRVPIGRYNADQMGALGVKNDSISSMKVPPGLIARFYSDSLDLNGNVKNQNNKYVEIDGADVPEIKNLKWNDQTNIPKLNDSISSIIVQAKPFDPNIQLEW